MSADAIARAIYNARFRFASERDLQQGIGQVLTKLGVEWKPEVVLTPKDRIDFVVGGIGIETKVDGSLASVTRQLWRYAHLPEISELILVTTRAKHRTQPNEMNGKPLLVVHLISFF